MKERQGIKSQLLSFKKKAQGGDQTVVREGRKRSHSREYGRGEERMNQGAARIIGLLRPSAEEGESILGQLHSKER